MTDPLEAVRRELRESLSAARASLALVRGSPAWTVPPGCADDECEREVSGDDV